MKILLSLFFNLILLNTAGQKWTFVEQPKCISQGTIFGARVASESELYYFTHFNFSMTIGDTTLYSTRYQDALVAKYDTLGNVKWVTKIHSNSPHLFIYDLRSVDSFFYIGGTFSNEATFDTINIRGHVHSMFLAKYTASGKVVWAKSFGAKRANNCAVHKISIDDKGNIFATGDFDYALNLGSVTLNAKTNSSFELSDYFVAQFNPDGTCIWAKRGGGLLNDDGRSLCARNSNVVVTGHYYSDAKFGPFALTHQGQENDFFIAKYDVNGKIKWVKGFPSIGLNGSLDVKQDNKGNIYVCGVFEDSMKMSDTMLYTKNGNYDAFISKFNKNGKHIISRSIKSDSVSWFNEIAIGNENQIVVVGTISDSSIYQKDTLYCKFQEMVVLRLDSNLNLKWSKINGFGYSDRARTCDILNNSIYVAGGLINKGSDNFDCIEITSKRFGRTGIFGKISNQNHFTIDLGDDKAICDKNPIVLKSNIDSINLVWNNSSTDDSLVVTTPGVYWLKGDDGCGNSIDTINVYAQTRLFSLGNDSTICKGDSIQLMPNRYGTERNWNDFTTDSTIHAKKEGIYWLEQKNECGHFIDSVTITIFDYELELGEDTTLCNGDTLVLKVDNRESTLKWNNNDTNNVMVLDSAGNYTVTVTNKCGVFKDSIQVNFINEIKLNLGIDTNICKNDSLFLTAQNKNANYQWSNATTKERIWALPNNMYWVKVSNQCEELTDSIWIGSIENNVSLGNDTTLCLNDSLKLSVDSDFHSVLWSNGTSAYSYSTSIDTLIWVKVLDNCGAYFDTLRVNYKKDDIRLGNDTAICEGQEFVLQANKSFLEYNWNNDSTFDSTIIINSPGIYWLRAKSECGLISDTIIVNYISPKVNLGPDTSLCQNEEITLFPTWAEGELTWNNNSNDTFLIVGQPGVYWVTVQQLNCVASDSIIVSLVPCDPILSLPNVFSPNNDGSNDIFQPLTAENIEMMNTIILNRWGNQIFQSDEIEINWDGGNHINGTYFWLVNAEGFNGEKIQLTGTILLLR